MRFCIRRSINLVNARDSLQKVKGLPVELSLHMTLGELLGEPRRLMDLKRIVKESAVAVNSVHAPLLHFSADYFRNAVRLIVAFAESLGAGVVVLQPEKEGAGLRSDQRDAALQNLRIMQEKTRVKLAVETFWEENRVLRPDEIMQHHLPLVLDTSLIPKPEIAWIMETYRTHIVNVHLSAVTHRDEQHLAGRQFRPVENDPFCLDMLDRMHELEWEGVVTLEYLPWLSEKSIEDRNLLERIYSAPSHVRSR